MLTQQQLSHRRGFKFEFSLAVSETTPIAKMLEERLRPEHLVCLSDHPVDISGVNFVGEVIHL